MLLKGSLDTNHLNNFWKIIYIDHYLLHIFRSLNTSIECCAISFTLLGISFIWVVILGTKSGAGSGAGVGIGARAGAGSRARAGAGAGAGDGYGNGSGTGAGVGAVAIGAGNSSLMTDQSTHLTFSSIGNKNQLPLKWRR